jgi:hypothetical protein
MPLEAPVTIAALDGAAFRVMVEEGGVGSAMVVVPFGERRQIRPAHAENESAAISSRSLISSLLNDRKIRSPKMAFFT